MALAARLHGGIGVLFAAEEPQLDLTPYRQDSDFYYLTGWTEPGAALLIVGDAPQAASPRPYKEILFLPARNLRMEAYTGAKMDASTPGVKKAVGIDAVEPMTELPAELSRLMAADRTLERMYGRNRNRPRPWRYWNLRRSRWGRKGRRSHTT